MQLFYGTPVNSSSDWLKLLQKLQTCSTTVSNQKSTKNDFSDFKNNFPVQGCDSTSKTVSWWVFSEEAATRSWSKTSLKNSLKRVPFKVKLRSLTNFVTLVTFYAPWKHLCFYGVYEEICCMKWINEYQSHVILLSILS